MGRAKDVNFWQSLSLKFRLINASTLKWVVEVLSVVASVYVIAQFIPSSLTNSLPATGGDTGSHFWPVKVLREYGIPHGILRPWNPGNNGGEGLLVHYFPLPFILMSLMGFVLPLGMAFNLGTIIPVLSLPVSVWVAIRLMTGNVSLAVISAIGSAAVVLNEGYSMWGGNTLSTLSGQFAHMYALNFLILGMGILWNELDRRKIPWRSAIVFSAVALSHGYLYFGVPPMLGLIVLLHPRGTILSRLSSASFSGVISLLLSVWFVGPMIMNGPWVTPHSFSWTFQSWAEEVYPRIFEPLVFGALLSLLILSFRGIRKKNLKYFWQTLFWFFSGMIYLLCFFVFRWLKLVDVRAIPQTQMFWAMTIGCMIGMVLEALPRRLNIVCAGGCVALMAFWETIHVVKFPIWMEWNYSGWQSKTKYQELLLLSQDLKGNLSQPRVAYEHHLQNNQVGTERVFEMLPYFANRATTESLYLQSTVLAPMIFSLTSEISESSSCPFNQWPCLGFNLSGSQGRQELLGVKELILSSKMSLNAASEANYLQKKFTYGPWTVFENKTVVPMVETFSETPEVVSFSGWRERFWNWFRVYQKGARFLVAAESKNAIPSEGAWVPQKECHPTTEVDFSGVVLKTDCPGVAHFLKYAYHPSFTSSEGERIFLVSPGFIGVVPSKAEIRLDFGSSWQWIVFRWISIVAFIGLVILVVKPQFLVTGSCQKWISNSVQKLDRREYKLLSAIQQPNRLFFKSLCVIFILLYGWISYRTEAIFFWNWRKLNFNEFELMDYHQGYGMLHKNENLDGNPIVLKGVIYYSGLTTHADSQIRIKIKADKKALSGICGYPDYVNGAEISCEIKSGDRLLFRSAPLNNANREARFTIPVFKGQEILFLVKTLKENIDAAHAVWVNLKAVD